MALINLPSTGIWQTIVNALNSMFADLFGRSGYADYRDTQYTPASPFPILANTPTPLPNNAGNTYDVQKPLDVDTFYDGTVITGRDGDGLALTFDFKAVPTAAGTTEIKIYIDITAGTGIPENLANLYPRLITFNKGVGVAKDINFTVLGYTRDTWEANGGIVMVETNGTCNVYDIRYVTTRTHKAR